MTPERWKQVKEIFSSALKHDAAQRPAYLLEACGDNDALRQEIESLIASHEKTGTFIDAPAYKGVADLVIEQTELKPGQTIAGYEIISFISRGGMGEVYRAQDRRLGRRVALKILPASVTKNDDRLRRFEQEARAASALNHPNILTIHEIGTADNHEFIATEFVEGETLRQRLTHNELTLRETLHVAVQIADALTAAHQVGIIHRDIKPENIMIRPDGYVKVLDFGLAKLAEPASPLPPGEAPTKQVKTGSGMILGTVAYMSPEQARGKAVDARSDVFSLGAVIYEMVTGRKPFDGETPSDILAAVLRLDPPPISHLISEPPAELTRILVKALRKDREERYQGIKDLLLDLKSLKEELDFQAKLDGSGSMKTNDASAVLSDSQISRASGVASSTGEIRTAVSTITHSLSFEIKRHKTGIAFVVVAIVLAAVVVGVWFMRGRTHIRTALNVGRVTQVTTWSGLDDFPSLSPDGNSVAYCSDHTGDFEIYVKQLTTGAREIQLTSDKQQNFQPAWSPDGQRIAYYSKMRGGIWMIPASGGEAKQLTTFGSYPAWSPDGKEIAFRSNQITDLGAAARDGLSPSTLWLVSTQGGEPRQLTQVGNPAGGHSSPAWSPDGRRIVFEVDEYFAASIWTISVNGNDATRVSPQSGAPSYTSGYVPVYAPDGQSVLYNSAQGVWQVYLDSQTGEPLGEPSVVPGIGGVPSFVRRISFSADGKKAAYSLMRRSESISSVSLQTKSAIASGLPFVLAGNAGDRSNFPSFSPDGKQIAFGTCDLSGSGCHVWLMNTDGSNQRQLTTADGSQLGPTWFPDMTQIAYNARRAGHFSYSAINLESKRENVLLDLPEGVDYARLSPDAQWIAMNSKRGGDGITNVWIASVAGGEFKQLTFDKELMGFPAWSPDSKSIAFQMKRGDDTHVMIMPREGGSPTQLTFEKGQSWIYSWSPDGDKILFAGFRNGFWNIWWVSRTTKKEQQLTDYKKLNSFVRYPSWSPKGDQIAYEYSETTGNIWVMDLK